MSEQWQDDLLHALQQLEPTHYGDGLTTTEIADSTGWSVGLTDRRVRALWKAGAIETCHKSILTRAGYYHSVPAYRKKA